MEHTTKTAEVVVRKLDGKEYTGQVMTRGGRVELLCTATYTEDKWDYDGIVVVEPGDVLLPAYPA